MLKTAFKSRGRLERPSRPTSRDLAFTLAFQYSRRHAYNTFYQPEYTPELNRAWDCDVVQYARHLFNGGFFCTTFGKATVKTRGLDPQEVARAGTLQSVSLGKLARPSEGVGWYTDNAARYKWGLFLVDQKFDRPAEQWRFCLAWWVCAWIWRAEAARRGVAWHGPYYIYSLWNNLLTVTPFFGSLLFAVFQGGPRISSLFKSNRTPWLKL
jgi:hypothetical protein